MRDEKRWHFVAKYGSSHMLDHELDHQLADPERKDMKTGEGYAKPKFLQMAFHHNKANLSAKFVNYAYKHGDEAMMCNACAHPLISHENLNDAVHYPYSSLQVAATMHKNITDEQLHHLAKNGESSYVKQLASTRLKQSPELRQQDSAVWHKGN